MGTNLVLHSQHKIKHFDDLEAFQNQLRTRKIDFLYLSGQADIEPKYTDLIPPQWLVTPQRADYYYASLDACWNDEDYPEYRYFELEAPEVHQTLEIYKSLFRSYQLLRWHAFTLIPLSHIRIRQACFELHRVFEHPFIYVPDNAIGKASNYENIEIEQSHILLSEWIIKIQQECGPPAPGGWIAEWDELSKYQKPDSEEDSGNSFYDTLYYLDDFNDLKSNTPDALVKQLKALIDYTVYVNQRYYLTLPLKGALSVLHLQVPELELKTVLKQACNLLKNDILPGHLQAHNVQIEWKHNQFLTWPKDVMSK